MSKSDVACLKCGKTHDWNDGDWCLLCQAIDPTEVLMHVKVADRRIEVINSALVAAQACGCLNACEVGAVVEAYLREWEECQAKTRADGSPPLAVLIDALLDLDARGALEPHGVGGHARNLLERAARALSGGRPRVYFYGARVVVDPSVPPGEVRAMESVRCELCGDPTPAKGTRRCNRCRELERRIESDPGIAARILFRVFSSAPYNTIQYADVATELKWAADQFQHEG